jgi:hypothetical protein
MIAMYLMMDTGLMAPVRGWLRRAERLLDGLDDTPAHALIAMVRTYERLMCGDMEGRRRLGSRSSSAPDSTSPRPSSSAGWPPPGSASSTVTSPLGLELLDEVGALLMSGGRSADDRDDVLRARLRGPGAGARRPARASGPR